MLDIPLKLDLIKNLPIYCKIRCFGGAAPCQLNLNYQSGHPQIDVFASFKDKLPDENNYDFKRHNPK